MAKCGIPLIIGISKHGNFVASDKLALLQLTKKFITLSDGDIAEITIDKVSIYDKNGVKVKRKINISNLSLRQVEIGKHQHFMHKEIFEQPQAISDTLEGRIKQNTVVPDAFGVGAKAIFSQIKKIQIIACGTSYNAGLVAKYWLEDIVRIATTVEVASEYRYRNPVVVANTLFVFISQSGETADTLAALKIINEHKERNTTLAICNNNESTMVQNSDLVFLTHAGPEIGVASTKAFTTQLTALALLTVAIGKCSGSVDVARERSIVDGLRKLPTLVNNALNQEKMIKHVANDLGNKENVIFLGRGAMHAIAAEGALKLKEISYIFAHAYPAGELKHGPIALIDKNTPVIVVAPNDELLDKLKVNLAEVKSRGSKMIVFEDENSQVMSVKNMTIIPVASNVGRITAPIIFTIALQLLSYHVALIKGTDIDKPRNLAKSVTVE